MIVIVPAVPIVGVGLVVAVRTVFVLMLAALAFVDMDVVMLVTMGMLMGMRGAIGMCVLMDMGVFMFVRMRMIFPRRVGVGMLPPLAVTATAILAHIVSPLVQVPFSASTYIIRRFYPEASP